MGYYVSEFRVNSMVEVGCCISSDFMHRFLLVGLLGQLRVGVPALDHWPSEYLREVIFTVVKGILSMILEMTSSWVLWMIVRQQSIWRIILPGRKAILAPGLHSCIQINIQYKPLFIDIPLTCSSPQHWNKSADTRHSSTGIHQCLEQTRKEMLAANDKTRGGMVGKGRKERGGGGGGGGALDGGGPSSSA